jgi:hypothetical protein
MSVSTVVGCLFRREGYRFVEFFEVALGAARFDGIE